ncbi:hypothetical protein CTA2_4379, partial [Colletotrichum tanaceti]
MDRPSSSSLPLPIAAEDDGVTTRRRKHKAIANMSRILMGRALRGAKACVWEQQACMTQQQRSFSQTPSRQRPKVIFDKNTSPDLSPILEEIQSNIILPYHLPIHQRKRVFSEKLKHRLKSDPVYLEIDGLEHRFSHINKDTLPPSREMTWKALQAMQTPRDWNNFTRLLSGMRNAGRRYSQDDYLKMIHIAGDQGQIYTIIDAARQVHKTGLRFDDLEKVNLVLYFVQMRAVESDWDKKKTEQALRWSEMVFEMLEDPKHRPKERDTCSLRHSRRWKCPFLYDPLIRSALLHLSAVLAVKHNDGKDIDGKVANYATQVVDEWPWQGGLIEVQRQSARREDTYLIDSLTQYLSHASPILHGLYMAARVVEDPLAERVSAIAEALAIEVNEAVREQKAADDVFFQMLGYRAQELLLGEPLAGEQPVGVAVGAVAQDGDDGVALADLLGDLLGGDDVEGRAGAQIQALLVEAAVDHLDALLVGDGQRAVDEADVGLEVVRDAALADALGDAGPRALDELAAGRDVRVQHAAGRVGEERLDAAAADVLEVPRDAGERARGARGAGEGVDAAARLLPDLGPRGLDVGAAVGRVVELVRPDGVVEPLGVAPRLVVVVVRVLERHGGHGVDLGAQQPQQVDLALGLRVGHVDDELVALGAAHVREADARVAGGALDDGAAGLEEPALLGVLDDVERRAILDRAARVHELGLAEDLAARLGREAVEADEGGVADGCGMGDNH